MAATGEPVTLVIARFEDLVARGLRAVIEDDPRLVILADRVEHRELGPVLAGRRPRVAIVNFGALRTALELRDLSRRLPETRLLVLATRPSRRDCDQLLAFGATSCLSTDVEARDILAAVHLASRGLRVLPQGHEEDAAGAPGPALLTPREGDVLALLQDGRTNGEIALALHVGLETVRTHARNIYRKLGVGSRRDLAALAPGRRAGDGVEPRQS